MWNSEQKIYTRPKGISDSPRKDRKKSENISKLYIINIMRLFELLRFLGFFAQTIHNPVYTNV